MEGTLTSRSDTYIGHCDSGLYHSLCSSVLKDIVLDNGIEWGNRIDSAGFERIIVDLKQVDPHIAWYGVEVENDRLFITSIHRICS